MLSFYTQRFSDASREYRKTSVALNGLNVKHTDRQVIFCYIRRLLTTKMLSKNENQW